jgi:hypothetical protein
VAGRRGGADCAVALHVATLVLLVLLFVDMIYKPGA